jgi:methionyl-tRNA synthetase
LNFYINFIISALFDANKYFNDQEPWKKKDDTERLNTIVFTALELIRKVCIMLYPIIPDTSIRALKIFDLNEADIIFSSIKNHEYLKPGKKINKIGILFKKVEKNND